MRHTTEQKLELKYGRLTMTMKQVAHEINMEYRSLLGAISAGRFPIPTVKTGGRRIAKVADVADFIDGKLKTGAKTPTPYARRMHTLIE